MKAPLPMLLLATAVAIPALARTPGISRVEPFDADLEQLTLDNEDYRRVLATGHRLQLAVMSLPPGGEIGPERHAHVEQLLVCLRGNGEAILDGRVVPFDEGTAVLVPAGTRHNLRNTGNEPLKLYTLYAPPNHLPTTVHPTRADAEADVADERYGEQVR